jgi:hypothetical protein
MRDFGSSMPTQNSTKTRDWFTVSVPARKSISDQRKPSASPAGFVTTSMAKRVRVG